MTIPLHVANELAWALETTQNPPRVSHRGERLTIEREYRRLYALLHELDLLHRGKTLVSST